MPISYADLRLELRSRVRGSLNIDEARLEFEGDDDLPPDTPSLVDQLWYLPYVRIIENNWRYFIMREVMRSTAGLEVLFSELFYRVQLTPREGPPGLNRPRTDLLHSSLHEWHPTHICVRIGSDERRRPIFSHRAFTKEQAACRLRRIRTNKTRSTTCIPLTGTSTGIA